MRSWIRRYLIFLDFCPLRVTKLRSLQGELIFEQVQGPQNVIFGAPASQNGLKGKNTRP